MRRRERLGAGWWLFVLGVVLYMTLPAPLLSLLGIAYDSPGGPVVVKFHAGTYVLCLATVVLCAGGGNPLRGLAAALLAEGWLALHLASTLLLLVWSVYRHGVSGSAFVIESLMMAPLCALAVGRMGERGRRLLFRLVMAAIVANALLAIGEAALGRRLLPYTVSGGVVIRDLYFRATALQGHPLENALLTATFAALSFGLRLGGASRGLMLAVLLLGLLAFGSRTGFVVTMVVLAVALLAQGAARAGRGHLSYGRLMGGGAALALAVAVAAAATAGLGLGERIFATMAWDDSASVRLRVWSAFDYLSTADLVFGIPPAAIEDVIYRLGLHYPQETIENFWLLMLMQFGIVGMVPFVGGLAAGGWHLWRLSEGPGRLALLLFLAVASSNNSLAAKTHSMALVYTAIAAAGISSPRLRDGKVSVGDSSVHVGMCSGVD